MSATERAAIVDAAKALAGEAQAGNSAAVKAGTVASVAANFDGIAKSVEAIAPLIKGAAITVDAVYGLDASDAKPGEDEAQFFCNAADAATQVTFTIPHLPPGRFAFAVVHATGVAKPQQLALLLEFDGQWKLAGFFPRPLTAAGHDGLWYWKQARAFAQKKQNWNAYFYYTTATYLLAPANFLTSSNLDKLVGETQSVKPPGLPGASPMTLSDGGKSFSITSLRTDDAFNGLDLVVRYTATGGSDAVAARAETVNVMKALVKAHPELRDGFHGLWVFADGPSGAVFSLEQPMTQTPPA
ncbi:MAG: hypothetical protein ACR2JE_14580 [Acidobacteriaceae bacterium]